MSGEFDADIERIHKKLLKVRERTDLKLPRSKYLRDSIVGFDGTEEPLRVRYYQIQMVVHMMAMTRFVNGEDTGLGKTFETIMTLCQIWEKNPNQKVLILTSKSALSQWVSEFVKFTKGIRVLLSRGDPDKRIRTRVKFINATGPTVMVSGYKSLMNDFSEVQDWEDHIVVFDECTVFKNPKTQVHQVCKHISDRAARAYGLTATLIKNKLFDGFGIYKVIKDDVFSTKTKFMTLYCVTQLQKIPGKKFKIPIVVGHSQRHIRTFRERISPFFLGRAKFEVASELPVLTTRQVLVDLTHEQETAYNDALVGVLRVGGGETIYTDKLTAIIYCQQIANHLALLGLPGGSEKEDTLLDFLTEGEFADENVIIYTRFKKMVDHLMPLVQQHNVPAVRITGDENDKARKEAMRKFQSPGEETRVVFITDAGSEAINLQSAKVIIFYDTPWAAGQYLQILGRMIRIGSLHDRVYAIHLVARGTVDVRTVNKMRGGLRLIEAALGKRIKGELESDIIIRVEDEISDIFSGLREDALQKNRT